MKTFLALPLLLDLLLGTAKPGRTEVFLNLESDFYSVNVASNAPLFQQLLRASPITVKSAKYTGYTPLQSNGISSIAWIPTQDNVGSSPAALFKIRK